MDGFSTWLLHVFLSTVSENSLKIGDGSCIADGTKCGDEYRWIGFEFIIIYNLFFNIL